MIGVDGRYAVESVAVGQEVDNWIFSISREAPRAGGQHDTGKKMVVFVVIMIMTMVTMT